MLGHSSLIAEQQHDLKKTLEAAKADALAAYDRVGFLESLAVCVDEDRALARHQVCCAHTHTLLTEQCWNTCLHPAAAATPANFVSWLAMQERCRRAVEAFDAALLCHCGIETGKQQQQQRVLATKAELDAELSRIAAAAVQQVRAAAAAAAARHQAGAGGMSKQLEHTAAESALQAFKAQLQQLEDDCTDPQAAQQACKVRPLAQTPASGARIVPSCSHKQPHSLQAAHISFYRCAYMAGGAGVSNLHLCYPATPCAHRRRSLNTSRRSNKRPALLAAVPAAVLPGPVSQIRQPCSSRDSWRLMPSRSWVLSSTVQQH